MDWSDPKATVYRRCLIKMVYDRTCELHEQGYSADQICELLVGHGWVGSPIRRLVKRTIAGLLPSYESVGVQEPAGKK